MKLKIVFTALVAAILAATVSVTPAYAADGDQTGIYDSPETAIICEDHFTATACFEKYGDKLWISNSDWEFVGYTKNEWENWLYDGSSWVFWRSGACFDDGEGWFVCNKNFYESSSTNALGGKGSTVFWRACELNASWTCSGWKSAPNNG